jgi:hypothetical protein
MVKVISLYGFYTQKKQNGETQMKTSFDTDLRVRTTSGMKQLYEEVVGSGNVSKSIRKHIDETIIKYMEKKNEPNKSKTTTR